MVYQDISDSKKSPHQEFKFKVSLMDRFFSFVIDYLIFSPFVSFILFLFFQDALRYWKQNPGAPEQTSLTLLLGFCYVSLFSLLQAFFIVKWRATPGQYFLKIRIAFENDGGLILGRAFSRQFGFWFSILFLGIPWLALLSHPLQKTFYDRLADCRVFSKKESNILGFETETRFWQAFGATLMLFTSLLAVAVVVARYREVANRTESFKQLEKTNQFCAELKGVSQATRLQLAIALNFVGQLSDDCLDREADFVLWKGHGEESHLAYYAKSLTEDDSEYEQKYLKQACPDNGDEISCHLANAYATKQFDDLYVYLKKQKTLLGTSLAYEFGLILKKTEDQDTNFAELAAFDQTRAMKKYLLSELIFSRAEKSSRSPASAVEDAGLNHEARGRAANEEMIQDWLKDL